MGKRVKFIFGNPEIRRSLVWFIYPTLFLNAFFMATIPEYRAPGALYLIMGLTIILFYFINQKNRQFYGTSNKFGRGLLWGGGIALGFLFIGNVMPGFTILIPSLSFSILTGIRFLSIVIVAPWVEENFFNSLLLNLLVGTYGLSVTVANFLKSIIFSIFHILAYGVALSGIGNLIELFGAVNAIFGTLFMAFIFSLIIGYVAILTKDLLPGKIAHMTLNGVLWSLGFVIFTL